MVPDIEELCNHSSQAEGITIYLTVRTEVSGKPPTSEDDKKVTMQQSTITVHLFNTFQRFLHINIHILNLLV
jgi:hypothetical protein